MSLVPPIKKSGNKWSLPEFGMLVYNNFNERQMVPSLSISFYIPNIVKPGLHVCPAPCPASHQSKMVDYFISEYI